MLEFSDKMPMDDTSYKIKLFLHNHIYNNDNYIKQLIKLLEDLNLFIIDYIEEMRTFNLKIKKTKIKKKYNHIHDSLFYYKILNDIFINLFLLNVTDIDYLLSLHKNTYNINIDSIQDVIRSDQIKCIYDIIAIADNTIVLKL